ncbi:MAG: LCP family protein [Nocardioidaceae bacterium]|nr:LCP family protein [Nocardioidaceae bacterium]
MDADESHTPAPTEHAESSQPRARRRHPVLWGLLACVVALALIIGGAGFYLQQRLSSQVTRIPDSFAGLSDRPSRADGAAGRAVNILLMGSDKRDDAADHTDAEDSADAESSWAPGLQRSDTLMVLHVAADRRSASIISIPRDSWVDVPGYGKNKINAAFSLAGPSLAVETVEKLTNVRIDHLAIIDWDGFRSLTDALGGVEVTIPETTVDTIRDKTWQAGTRRLDGEEALLYVRQRYGLTGGDFDRVKRQQNFLRSAMQETLSDGTLRSPRKIYGVLDAITSNLSVDSGWSTGDMRGLALSLRNLRSSDVTFATVPVEGTGMEGAQSVVYLNEDQGKGLWGAVLEDRATEWLAANPEGNLPGSSDVS